MKYLKAILSLASVGLLLYTVYEQNESINKYKAERLLSKDILYIDSLREELFQAQSQNGKFELGLDHLKETDSAEFNEVEKFIDNETE
jgi:hypothetical protein